MDDNMKQALLEWCERHAKNLNDEFFNALDDLAVTIVSNTENTIDDIIVYAVKDKVIEIGKEFLEKYIDKIDGVEGNLGEDA